MSERDFMLLEQELSETADQGVAKFLAFFEEMWLEATMFDDGCAGCAFQAANGSRAAGLARAELNRRP